VELDTNMAIQDWERYHFGAGSQAQGAGRNVGPSSGGPQSDTL